MKVMVVDDNEQNLYLLEVLLRSEKYEVVCARDGLEALEHLKKGSFSLIISDILMPRMDGFRLCRECKVDPHLKHIPFIFYTATYTDQKDEEFALSLGAERFIVKPIEPQIFLTTIREVIKEYEKGALMAKESLIKDEELYLAEYSKRLIQKLEKKMLDLEIANKTLAESEKKYRILVENAGEAILVAQEGMLKFVNPRATEMIGYAPEELTSRPFTEFIHLDDRALVMERYTQRLQGSTIPATYAFRIIHRSGDMRWVELNTALIEWQGKPATLNFLTDITERKRAEEEIRRLNESLEQRVQERTAQLEAANKEMEAFTYSVSHDLRAPLRAVDGYTQILLEKHASHLNDDAQSICGNIREGAQRMGRLIDDLLAFSRLGRAEMQASTIDMHGLANSVFFELTTPESRESIDFRLQPLPRAEGDPTMVRQIWMNLISNALKFSSKRERPFIEVGWQEGTKETIYSIRDNGAGFDKQYVHRLFGVFERLHSTREFEGTGVGLAIVRRIVHRHGGRTWAEGETDKGATFYFTMPKKGERG